MSYEFWNDLLLMRKHYSQSLEQACQNWSMTRAEMDVLLFLANNPAMDRAADIVELRGLTKSHVSIAVKQLCQRGYLASTQDKLDRRVIHLKPTAAAAGAIEDGQRAQRQHWEKVFEGFTAQELEQFCHLQRKMFANVKSAGEQDDT